MVNLEMPLGTPLTSAFGHHFAHPEINETKRSSAVTRRFEVVILSPVLAITDAVRIQGIRLKITKDSRMIMGIIDVALE